ncbi:MAG: riboflavin synthase [Candidatus Zixiibacteriota bacterium]
MFTGLVQEMGTITRLERHGGGLRWSIAAPQIARELNRGGSVNIAGACQTVEKVDGGTMTGTSIPETLKKTNFANWRVGQRVNLEPAMRASDRLGGHLVSGHVDTTGTIARRAVTGEWVNLTVEFDTRLSRWVIQHGSVAIDGVSLTIADCAAGSLTVALIPETLKRTTLGSAKVGDTVNLEFDQVIKAVVQTVENLVSPEAASTEPFPMSFPRKRESILETLERAGYR